MKVCMNHPNGDQHEYDLGDESSAKDLLSDIEFELSSGGAEWLGVSRFNLSVRKQSAIFDRISLNLPEGDIDQ